MIILIKGEVDVTSSGPKVKLPLDTYCYIKDGKVFSGTECDMVVVALRSDKNPWQSGFCPKGLCMYWHELKMSEEKYDKQA